MDNIKNCFNGSRWCCRDREQTNIARARALPDDHILQLLANIENTIAQIDGNVKIVPMSEEVQNYAAHLEKHLNKVIVGAQISKDVLNALGNLHWVGAGLTIIAMGLDTTLKMHVNREQCNDIMKESLDIWKKVMKPVLEKKGSARDFMEESMGIIIECYLYCKNLLNSRTFTRFICAICHEKELETLKKKLQEFLVKASAVMLADLNVKLSPIPPTAPATVATTVVGLEERKRDVLKLLKLEDKEETRVVVLHGIGGVGKSTLADVVYKQVSVSRERNPCRIEFDEKPSKDDIMKLQRQMVENLTGQSLMAEIDPEVIRDTLRQLLLSKIGNPVFIYMDNVLQSKDLEAFFPLDCELIRLPKGSRWLVTTRDESVCTKVFQRNPCFEVEKFKVMSMNDRDAQKLFFLHAFGQEEPSSEVVEKYDDGQCLIREMVSSICGNLPLALRVLGRSLFNTNVHAWRKKYDDLKSHGNLELEEQIAIVLTSSYDTLDGETQTAFLMACVCFHDFSYEDFKDVVESILPRATVSRIFELGLLERCTIELRNHLLPVVKMHGLVRTFGYQMAVARKCAPAKMDDDDESWSSIKWLRVPPLENGIEAELLEKCRELEVIVLDTHVNGQIESPPQKLKVVVTPSRLPLQPDKLKDLVYLQVLDEDAVVEFPVARSTRRLQMLKGFSCASIPKEAIDLHKSTLRTLWCKKIGELSSYFCQEMTKLQYLEIKDYEGESFPKEMGSLTGLETLRIYSSITILELPESLGHLRRLRSLSLCLQNLKDIPCGLLGGMEELAHLQLELNRVTSMPMQDIAQLGASLEVLDLDFPSVNRLTDGLVSLKLEKLKSFTLQSYNMSSLEGVQLSCPSLQCVRLALPKLKVLPSKFITESMHLRNLLLVNCLSLQELSMEMEILWALESLAVENCGALKAFPEGLMKSVECLAVIECPGMRELPCDLNEQKARSMRFIACDTHLLPPQFLALPTVVPFSAGDWRARQLYESFSFESFCPLSVFDIFI